MGDEKLVARFAHPRLRDTLYKDYYVSTKLVSPHVPVAEFVAIGDFEGGTYAVTRRCPGKILDELDKHAYKALIPQLVEVLEQIHQSDVSATRGYGSFDAEGNGRWKNWASYLLAVGLEETDELGFYGQWHSLFDEGILERDFFFLLYDELKERSVELPDVRSLVHADFGFDNVLANDGGVTAVIDWANASFGDFLFDVARMQLLQPVWDFEHRFQELYSAQDRELPCYENRMWCCTCYMALDLMRFYAQTKRPDAYLWAKEKVLGAGLQ
jgi:hygromycin-B 4-O-kinase